MERNSMSNCDFFKFVISLRYCLLSCQCFGTTELGKVKGEPFFMYIIAQVLIET
jgi:hypothetical protein